MKPPPDICDFDCPYADFPPAETAGICRTMSAVHCRLLSALVNKNTSCEWRARQPESKRATDTAKQSPRRAGRRARRA